MCSSGYNIWDPLVRFETSTVSLLAINLYYLAYQAYLTDYSDINWSRDDGIIDIDDVVWNEK
jgi:hypothetical protein